MEINHLKENNLVQELEIKLTQEDYLAKVDAELKKLRKTTQVSGFRVGNAPMGMIKKMYEKSVIADTVNHVASEAFFNYIDEHKINFIFEPLIDAEKSDVDYEKNNAFTFVYEFALAPEINIDLSKLEPSTYLQVVPSEKDIDLVVEESRKRHSKMVFPEVIDEQSASITLSIADREDPINVVYSTLNEEGKKAFTGLKKMDVVTLDFANIFENVDTLKSVLGLEEIEEGNPYNMSANIMNFSSYEPADINQELFDEVFPNGDITTEEAFRAKFGEELASQFTADSNMLFYHTTAHAIAKMVSFELPATFIKKYISKTNQEITAEQLENEYPAYEKYLHANLIQGKLAEMGEVKVTREDIKNYLFNFYHKSYFANMPMEDEQMKNILNDVVERTLNDEKQVKQLYDNLLETEIARYLKANVAIKEETCSMDEFQARSKAEVDRVMKGEEEAPAAEKKTRAPRKKATNEENE